MAFLKSNGYCRILMTSSSTASIPLEVRFCDYLTEVRFCDYLTGRRVKLALVADGKLQLPAELRTHVKRPLEFMQAAAWFFARQSPGMKRHLEEPPPPLSHMLTQISPCVLVRFMFGFVATACRRMTTAPAGMFSIFRTTGRWAAWIMERVTRGLVRKVQVRRRRPYRALHCACRVSACVWCVTVFDACCRERWMIFRRVAGHRSGCSKRAAAVIFLRSGLLAPALQAVIDPTFCDRLTKETAFR